MSAVTPTAGCVHCGRERYRGTFMPEWGFMPRYRVTGGPDGTAGLNYKSKRVEPGDVVDDIPRESIKWLREQGYIEIVGKDETDTVLETVEEGDE